MVGESADLTDGRQAAKTDEKVVGSLGDEKAAKKAEWMVDWSAAMRA